MSAKVSKRVRMYKEGYVSVHIFLTIEEDGSKYYDTVIYRKIKKKGNNGSDYEWIRGANHKPDDLPILVKLLGEADAFLKEERREVEPNVR